MDPIEKLLSDLAPARSPAALDQEMEAVFRKANRRASSRRLARTMLLASLFLLIGAGIGYQFGKASHYKPQELMVFGDGSSEAPVVRARPIFDFTVTATWPTESGGAPLDTESVPSTGI
jgi:hypothetical protein